MSMTRFRFIPVEFPCHGDALMNCIKAWPAPPRASDGRIMHGLLLRALQSYVLATFGRATWDAIMAAAGIRGAGFGLLVPYDAGVLRRVLAGGAKVLARAPEAILEDLGTFIIINPEQPAVRRLLRFGGAGFEEFLLSLDELPDRLRLALPGIRFPAIRVDAAAGGHYRIVVDQGAAPVAHVLAGVIRAMADDYGALVLIEAEEEAMLTIRLLDPRFASGRGFELISGALAGDAGR